MTAAAPLKWFDFRDHKHSRWSVFLSSAEHRHTVDLEWADGLTYFASKRVLIAVENDRTKQDEILLHELMHVACGDEYGKDGHEERIITKLAPRLLPLLRKFGLRFPRRPRGVAAIEQAVRDDEEEG